MVAPALAASQVRRSRSQWKCEALPEDIALAYAKVLRTPVYNAVPFEQRWSVWGASYGGYNKTSGDPAHSWKP